MAGVSTLGPLWFVDQNPKSKFYPLGECMITVITWDSCVKLTECQRNRKHGAVIPPFSTENVSIAHTCW